METLLPLVGVILLILLNGYFVASEYALVSVRKTRIEELAKGGDIRAQYVKRALNRLDKYISATQLGITFASLGLGWIGEPAIARVLEPIFSFMPSQASWLSANTLAVILAFILITFLDIILGELVPKTYVLAKSESTALFIITPLILFTQVFRPFIWLLNISGRWILTLFGVNTTHRQGSIYSEEEIKALLHQSSLGGVIPLQEAEMAINAFALGDIQVRHIMLSRKDTIAFAVSTSLDEVIERVRQFPHSRFPVYEKSLDHISGFVHVKDLFLAQLNHNENARLSDLAITRKIIHVSQNRKIDALLKEMRKKRIHLAAVVDDDDKTVGIVTLEDVIESVMGEIEDEFDAPSA